MTQPALSHDASPDLRAAFAAEVRAGLTHTPQKELPSKYLYDEVGSALFEVITVLPEYGVTRAEERLLAKHAADIVAHLPHDVTVHCSCAGANSATSNAFRSWVMNAITWPASPK
jgi:L-histidine Nalpha-methyltransferase